MAELSPTIEAMEHQWMRAWVQGDARTLKASTARSFILLTGSKPPAILDNRSWVEAATTRWHCSSYRFGDIYVRDVGGVVLFASQLEIKSTMDSEDWSGTYWVSDLWKKGRIRRGWKMAQRIMTRVDEDPQVAAGIRSLQLWKSGRR